MILKVKNQMEHNISKESQVDAKSNSKVQTNNGFVSLSKKIGSANLNKMIK